LLVLTQLMPLLYLAVVVKKIVDAPDVPETDATARGHRPRTLQTPVGGKGDLVVAVEVATVVPVLREHRGIVLVHVGLQVIGRLEIVQRRYLVKRGTLQKVLAARYQRNRC